ncbi:MAG TPA: type IV pilus assembly protein PilM [Sumerlaeia bacterium]|nr:type IV pilus assembly protein PilM [Sumerlaeia bacterium]
MAFWSRPSIGLDIGSRVVKAAQLKKAGKNIELEKFGVADIYPSGEKPASPEEVRQAAIDAIKRALTTAKITAVQAVTAVAGESIIVRYIQLPEMPEAELKNALRWEAEEYIPFRVEDVNIDSAIIGRSTEGEGGRLDVLLACVRKDLINDHVSLVKEAGLTPVLVDVDSFAFLNCYDMNYRTDPSEVIGLVNIGGDITSISVTMAGMPRFSRDISIGGGNITNAIRQRLDISAADAEALKIKCGAPKGRPGEPGGAEQPEAEGSASLRDTIRSTVEAMTGGTGREEGSDREAVAERAIRSTLNNLVSEIRRSIQFFENQSRGLSVGRLVIGGGAASLNGLDNFIQSEMNLPVEVIDPLLRIPVTGADIDPNVLRDNRHMLSVGIGLALRKVVD